MERWQQLSDSHADTRRFVLNDLPNLPQINTLVLVNQYIPKGRHRTPRNLWVTLAKLVRDSFCSLPDHFEASDDREVD